MRRLGKAILDVMPEVSPDERWETLRALDLSFLGIAALPSWIQVSLEKQGLAALDRFPAAKNHQLLGARLLKDIPRFAGVAAIIKLQGKDYNGYGEPLEEIIGGENLPLGSRLLRILHELERLTTPHFKGRAVLEQMLQYPAKFDTGLISRILQRQETRPQGESEREVLPDELRPGMVLVQDVLTRSDQCLLRAGATLIDTSITMLRQWHSKEPIEKKIAVRVAEQT